MALYTITLSDYLKEGGELPTLFNEIDDFTELFISKYFDCEIGFETTTLFSLKLQAKAKIEIPFYKEKIEKYTSTINDLETITKQYKTENSPITSKNYELPSVSDVSEIPPTTISNVEENIIVRKEEGKNIDDNIKLLKVYKEELSNIKEELLNKFNDLFMQIY